MVKSFQKIGALTMALLVLFSTLSFTVNKHFCGTELVDRAVFSEANTCGMHDQATESSIQKDSEDICCQEEKVLVEGQTELKMSFDELQFEQQVFLTSFAYSFIDLFEGLPEQVNPLKDYSPPMLVPDIRLLDQIFLI